MTAPSACPPGEFMPAAPPAVRPFVTQQARARRAEKDRLLAAQVRRSRIDESLAARERAIRAEFRSAA